MIELIINGSKILVSIEEAKRIYNQLQKLLSEDVQISNKTTPYLG
jgi:hypothetical protein